MNKQDTVSLLVFILIGVALIGFAYSIDNKCVNINNVNPINCA